MRNRIIAYSRPATDEGSGGALDKAGRIDAAMIQGAGIRVNADYYLCGPGEFMRDLSAALAARGVPPEQIAMEIFGAAAVIAPGVTKRDMRAPHQPTGPAAHGPAVLERPGDGTVLVCCSQPTSEVTLEL